MIKVFVRKTVAEAEVDTPTTSGSVGTKATFQFSEEWDALRKTAIFETDNYKEPAEIPESGEVEVPERVLVYPWVRLRIGVRGESEDGSVVIPTVYADCGTINRGANTTPVGTPPTPSQAEQLQAQIDDLRKGGAGGGSKIELDTTLTQPGKAADAKAVGDALAGVIDLKKYGITAADYVAPFTAAMYEVAYQNGLGIQNAIDDAKAKGMERITLPAGNYPLCYHAAADEEYNAIIDASGIDFYGYGVKLYVIYDEEGTNPYFTGATPRLLMGTIIKTDRDVRGFHLVGERRFRKDVNTKYRDNSKGIGLTHTVNGNTIEDCLTECVSGDGIGNESYMEQIAGWTPDTFTSIEWDYSTGAYVESNYMFVSAEHGGDWIDKTRPLLIRNTGYFLYSSAPLIIRCWNSEGEHIGVVQFWQGEYFYLPENTAKWRLELTRTVWHESTVTETWSFWIGYGTYSGTKIINCESRLNQRGGMSNLPNDVLLENCYIHNNGNAGEGMVQYYDTTRFGIDIEDVWIHKITLDGCRVMDNFNDFLFRCGKVVLKQTIVGNVYAMNQVVDFYAEQSVFTEDVKFENPTPFGSKLAIGCTFGGAIPDSLLVLDNHALDSAELVGGNMVMRNTAGDTICTVDMSKVMPVELTSDGLCMHYDFRQTPEDPRQPVDLVHGLPIYDARYTADNYSADGVMLCEGGGASGFAIASLEVPNQFNYAQVPEYAAFAEALRTGKGFTVEYFGKDRPNYVIGGSFRVGGNNNLANFNGLEASNVPYLDTNGNGQKFWGTQFYQFVDDEGAVYNVNAVAGQEALGIDKHYHCVVTADENGVVKAYLNGFPASTFDTVSNFAGWNYDAITAPSYWKIANGNVVAENNTKPVASVRMYNRALSIDEVRNNYRYELNYTPATSLAAATSDTIGGVKADPATAADTQPVRIGTDGKLYTAEGGGGGVWRQVADLTTEADLTSISITTDMDGNPLSFDEAVVMFAVARAGDAAGNGACVFGVVPWTNSFNANGIYGMSLFADVYAYGAHVERLGDFVKLEVDGGSRVAGSIAALTDDWLSYVRGKPYESSKGTTSILHNGRKGGSGSVFDKNGKLCCVTIGTDLASSVKIGAGSRVVMWAR